MEDSFSDSPEDDFPSLSSVSSLVSLTTPKRELRESLPNSPQYSPVPSPSLSSHRTSSFSSSSSSHPYSPPLSSHRTSSFSSSSSHPYSPSLPSHHSSSSVSPSLSKFSQYSPSLSSLSSRHSSPSISPSLSPSASPSASPSLFRYSHPPSPNSSLLLSPNLSSSFEFEGDCEENELLGVASERRGKSESERESENFARGKSGNENGNGNRNSNRNSHWNGVGNTSYASAMYSSQFPNSPPSCSTVLSIYCVYYLTFLGNLSFSYVLPFLWQLITNDGENYQLGVYLGFALTLFSAGQMIAAPLFDLWMDRRKSREVLGFSMVVLIFGSVIYGIAPWQTASIMLSRVLVGMAAANYNVTHYYLTYLVPPLDRMRVLSLQKLWAVLGFIAGPILSITSSLIDWNNNNEMLNDWTFPGYIVGFLGLVGLSLVLFVMEESPCCQRLADIKSFRDFLSTRLGQSFPDIASSLCIFQYIILTLAISTIETICIPFAFDHFGGSRFVTERNGAYFFVCIGVFCGLSIFVLRVARLCTNVNDPMLMIASFVFLVIGFSLMIRPGTTASQFIAGVVVSVVGYSLGISSSVSVLFMILPPAARVFMSNWISTGAAVSRVLTPLLVTFLYYPVGLDRRLDGAPSTFILFVVIEGLMVLSLFISVALSFRINWRKIEQPTRDVKTPHILKEALCL